MQMQFLYRGFFLSISRVFSEAQARVPIESHLIQLTRTYFSHSLFFYAECVSSLIREVLECEMIEMLFYKKK
jgi:hypothetical protein